MIKPESLENQLVITRAMMPNNLAPFLEKGAEVAPSLGGHKYSSRLRGNQGALGFGHYVLLANPEELNPKRNYIYRNDAWTPLSPPLQKFPNDDEKEKFSKKYYGIDKSAIPDIINSEGKSYLVTNDYRFPESKLGLYEPYRQWLQDNPDRVVNPYGDDEMMERMQKANFLADMRSYLENNSSGMRPVNGIETDEKSLRDYITKTPKAKALDYWRKKISNIDAPITNLDEMKKVIDGYLVNLADYPKATMTPTLMKRAVKNGMQQQFNAYRGSGKDRNLETFLKYGSPAERKPEENFIKKADMEGFLADINRGLKQPGRNDYKFEQSPQVVSKLNQLPTDYLEIKAPRVMKPSDYLGALYPANPRNEQEQNIIKSLKDVYGDKAIEYNLPDIDEWDESEDDEDEDRSNKVEKLAELMQKAGIV